MSILLNFLANCLLVCGLCLAAATAMAEQKKHVDDDPVVRHSYGLVLGDKDKIRAALEFLSKRAKRDVVPSMILAMRYRRDVTADMAAALETLTGHQALTWHDWMLWQQEHPEIKPHASFLDLKRDLLAQVDERYRVFFRTGWDQPADMRIRLEEIVWGGPKAMTGIPSLDFPKMIAAADADYLLPDDLVFGIAINGDIRAYPLRIMGWHEMFNDVIGGVPVALAYCTLCGSGILFETAREGREKPFVFGSSGMLYRSNKLMFDWETYSLWNQFTGEPVVGPLAKSGIRLKTRPVAITTWKNWRKAHPKTLILALETGYARNYASGAVYRDYFASPDLMFPATVRASKQFRQKDFIFGIRDVGVAKAWPVSAFARRRVINDRIGARDIVLIGNAETRTVRAYDRKGESFEALSEVGLRSQSGATWTITETHLAGPGGRKLPRIAGTLSYWFAWDGYLGLRSEYYQDKQ